MASVRTQGNSERKGCVLAKRVGVNWFSSSDCLLDGIKGNGQIPYKLSIYHTKEGVWSRHVYIIVMLSDHFYSRIVGILYLLFSCSFLNEIENFM